MTAKPIRQHGFSLVELMITILVAAILVAIAVPSFRDVIHRNEVSSSSNALLASLAYARTEAVNRGQFVSICPSSNGTVCTAGGQAFDPGWLVYTYPASSTTAAPNLTYDATSSTLLRATGAQAGVSIQSSGSTVITFGQQGQLDPSGTPSLKFVTCYRDSSTGTGTTTTAVPSAELDINSAGSVSTQSGTPCTP